MTRKSRETIPPVLMREKNDSSPRPGFFSVLMPGTCVDFAPHGTMILKNSTVHYTRQLTAYNKVYRTTH